VSLPKLNDPLRRGDVVIASVDGSAAKALQSLMAHPLAVDGYVPTATR
jgi:hypothetical protein